MKSRLAPFLGARACLALYTRLLKRTLNVLLVSQTDVHVHISGNSDHIIWVDFVQRFNRYNSQQGWERKLTFYQQLSSSDLGERMSTAIGKGLKTYERALLIGSDCPQMNITYIEQALQLLTTTDVVIGPALDGGYVLIGMKVLTNDLFVGIDWSSSAVLAQTAVILKRQNLDYVYLESLADIDLPRDLIFYNEFMCCR